LKVRNRTYLFSFYALVLLISSIFLSCKKDTNILGASVQDESDILNAQFSDTATIFAHTIYSDSTISFNDGVKFLGSNQDPVFGRTDVSLYTKFALPNNITNVSFGDDANLVSAEVVLAVKSVDFVGDYQTPLTYQVFEMSQNVPTGTINYSNFKNGYNAGNLLGTYTGTFEVLNGLFLIRIPINNTYASAILNNPQYLINNETFQNTYKGLYITTKSSNLNPSSAQGAITKMDLDNSLSGFHMYYQNGTVLASKETKTFVTTFGGTTGVRFNEFKYNYLNGSNNLLSQQLLGDSVAGSQGLFLKGMGGTRIKMQIPFLTNFAAKEKVSVNKAEITFKVDQGLNGSDIKYLPPLKIAILAIDSLNREIFTYDQYSSIDFARYGGNYDSDNKEYVFNISREIQILMNGKRKNLGFYIVVADGDRAYTVRRDDRAERVVLGGTGSTLYKPTLKLTYIPFTNN